MFVKVLVRVENLLVLNKIILIPPFKVILLLCAISIFTDSKILILILKSQTTDELVVIRFLGTGAHTLGQLYSVEQVRDFYNAL